MGISHFTRIALSATVLCGLTTMQPALAQSACLLDNPNKLCTTFESVVPADRVQPTAEGGTPTYIDYHLTLKNLGQTSTRYVAFALATSPDANFVEFSASMPGCTVSGADVSCQFDKIDAQATISFHALVQVPALLSPAQPDYVLANTATFGWNGNTKNVSAVTTVSVYGSASYVPPGQQVTLVTGPENPDRSLQTDADNPRWAKLTIPADFSHDGFYAKLEVVGDAPTFDCPSGIFIETHEDDVGLYVCRDVASPNRSVRTTFSENWLFETQPLVWDLAWDASIVPLIQLPPTPIGPTGTPPFAVFHRGGEDDAETRAYSKTCDANPTPCVGGVQRFGSGDWTATFSKRSVGAAGFDGDSSQDQLLQLPDLNCLLNGGCISTQGVIPPIGQGLIN